MNKVDELVRTMMLTYPSLYKSRSAALYSIFTDTGTNYQWDKKGRIVPVYLFDKKFEGPIDTSDLDQLDERFSGDSESYQTIRIENELERRERLYRAEHIDLLCQYGGRADYGYSELDHYTLDDMEGAYGVALMYRAPIGKIDPDWAAALERFIHDMYVAFNSVYLLHYDTPLNSDKTPEPSMYSRMPESMQRRYDNLVTIHERVETQTGSRAKAKAFWENGKGREILESLKND